ncbi:DUF1631 domain-containing protein [Microbulbifer flavimaris]|uniref:DUF1631 domain-containing protein n=1 Tax=Microbulbifer flavimaris TaxID=1781068 RepID=A0ABX4HWS6_9GAMM|nr:MULTISPECIES: DUF1631 domain-containing protein [Microbulbifer]KUJ81564.1 hypothetical protein AVO43_13495 [Microbulbifer sp. ZGT114]PCO04466.1 DUF1631 domain-containing protein [Microbulbifer flavimaris]
MDTNDFPRVVAFSGKNVSDSGGSRSSTLSSKVTSVRDTASSWLFARVKEIFTAVDDTLFATAEKVISQEEQDGLFQALRTLRLERNRVTDRFISAVSEAFEELNGRNGKDRSRNNPTGAESGSSDASLSLVQNDDLEQQVAIKTIIAAVKRDHASPIAELTLRLDTLLPNKVYDENMPLSPVVICDAFVQALAPLDIHLRARLTVLKKFEQLLGLKLGTLYQNCNDLLIQKGVLPGLKDPLLHRQSKNTRPSSSSPSTPEGAPTAAQPQPGEQGGTQGDYSSWQGGVPGGGMPAGGVPAGGMPGNGIPGAGMAPGFGSPSGGSQGMPGGAPGAVPGAPAPAGFSGSPAGAGMTGSPASGIASPAGGYSGQQGGGSGGFGLMPPSAGVAPMATPDLLQHLGELQVSVPLQAGPTGQLLDVSDLLQERLVEAKQKASLEELDSEVIRMVDMLFSFMLEDRNLAEPIKVQLIRLQLPLLKLAVADKAFFSKGGHPARKLFNALADAAIGWQPGDNFREEPFYREISSIVERVLEDFDRDEDIFVQLLDNFEAYVDRERRRAQVMERRTVEEAQGSARVEAAKARVAAVFDALTAERRLPKVVHVWLNRVWNSVLFRTCLKDGTDSDNWRRNVLTARDLVWSVVAPMPESSFKMQQLLPGLRKRLDEGARSLSLNAGDRQRLMQALDHLHRERQALADRVESERERRTRERLVQELRREADSIMRIPPVTPEAEASAEQAPSEPETAAPFAQEATALPAEDEVGVDVQELLDGDANLPPMKELEEVVQEAPQRKAKALKPLADSDEHWQQTYHLKDSWFMLHQPEKAPVRCRLAAIIRDLDQFMFVNRTGARVAVYTRLELAHALREEQMKPLEQGPLFERALQHVVGSIGESKIPVTVGGEQGMETEDANQASADTAATEEG